MLKDTFKVESVNSLGDKCLSIFNIHEKCEIDCANSLILETRIMSEDRANDLDYVRSGHSFVGKFDNGVGFNKIQAIKLDTLKQALPFIQKYIEYYDEDSSK